MSTDVMTRPDEDDYTLSEVAELLAGEKRGLRSEPLWIPLWTGFSLRCIGPQDSLGTG